MFTLQHSIFEMFYPEDVSELPQLPRDTYQGSIGPDETDLSSIPFFSSLINGMGRHHDVPLARSRLASFEVQRGNLYRFRLIGGQSVYLSVAGDKLSVIAADGFSIETVEQVDYIVIHSGEQYDFVLDANQTTDNYRILAETLEIDSSGLLPYNSLNNSAEAILHYTGADTPIGPNCADVNSETPTCTPTNPCRVFNCPFIKFVQGLVISVF